MGATKEDIIMATVFEELTIATEALHPDLNTELLSKTSAALRILQENAVRDTGDPITVDLVYKRGSSQWYDGYDTFDTDEVERLAQGALEWRQIETNVTISETKLVKNANMNLTDLSSIKTLKSLPSRDAKTIINIFSTAMTMAVKDHKDAIATALFASSPGAKEMESLPNIINLTSTYAGIPYTDLGTFDRTGLVSGTQDNKWAAVVDSNSGVNRALDHDLLTKVLNDISVGADKAKIAVCGRDAYVAIDLLLENTVTRRNNELAKIGFSNNVVYQRYDCTFVQDDYCDLNSIFFINTGHLKLYIHPALDGVFSGFKEPTDQAAVVGQLKTMLQIWCDDRHKQGLLADVQA